VIGNTALVQSLAYMHVGTRGLLGLEERRPWYWIATPVLFLALNVFTYAFPDVSARVVLLSLFMLPYFAVCGTLFWQHGEPQLRAIHRITAAIFFGGAILFFVRGVTAAYANVMENVPPASSSMVVAPFLYAVLVNVWLAVMLTLKVSARLQRRLAEALEQAEVANRELAEALESNETIILNSPLPMGVYDASGQCVLANEAHAQLVGGTRKALLAQNLHHIVSWQESGLLDDCLVAQETHTPQRREVHLRTSFGKEVWVECRILPTYLKGEQHLLIQHFDLTERKRTEETLRHYAFHDSLTLLPNRRLLLDRLGQALLLSKRHNTHMAVLFLDLDRFKKLNDAHGHDVGDKLLVEVANRLRNIVRNCDTVARYGGDEFVVLLEGLDANAGLAAEAAEAIADKIRRALSADYELGSIVHQCSASVGIKLILNRDTDADQILKEADIAMYRVKREITA
jgi:diguanylate cyclase (GGDEF)-like protein/PAS domain S-box-containing protein